MEFLAIFVPKNKELMKKYENIIGRRPEIRALLDAYESKKSEFIAVYGRRRVGKTYLVKEVFKGDFSFTYTGISRISNKDQLSNFRMSLIKQGYDECPDLKNWFEAFDALSRFIEGLPKGRKVIFIDELPWLDGRGSKFVPAFEHFWNGWADYRDDVLLIACGSATSWIINKIINSHGGLHNRLTGQIYLRPFTLLECEEYLDSRGVKLSRYDIVVAYMVLGGIPYYLSMLKKGKSVSQNINEMCFQRGGALTMEYLKLYDSLFRNPQPYLSVINALKHRRYGMTREEISDKSNISNNGHLTKYLAELEQCDFIRSYQSLGKKKKEQVYQLIDNFTLFYYSFMEQAIVDDINYWAGVSSSAEFTVWSGLAFERVCLWHIPQIKKSLGIGAVLTNVASWRTSKQQAEVYEGTQVDLAIVRADGIINLCEMKFAKGEYTINKKEDKTLRHRVTTFEALAADKKAVHLTMITPYGVAQNMYSSIVQSEVTMDDLFS